MTTLVADASALVALLVDAGSDGTWAAETLAGAALVAPHHVVVEVANVLRRLEQREQITADQAAQAHADLLDLPIALWPYELLAGRAWELRPVLTSYDAAYVALGEATGAPLVTLDRRLAAAPGIACRLLVPAA